MIFIAIVGTYCLKKFGADLPHEGADPIPQLHHNMSLCTEVKAGQKTQ